jgi:hypothetical protein
MVELNRETTPLWRSGGDAGGSSGGDLVVRYATQEPKVAIARPI